MSTNGRSVRFRLGMLICLLALLPGTGCGVLRRSAPAVDRSQDARIHEEVQARLFREPSLDANLIRVEVDGRTVLLYGSVRGLGAWKCALRNAGLVEGVNSVVDFLTLDRGPREAPCLAPADVDTARAAERDRSAISD